MDFREIKEFLKDVSGYIIVIILVLFIVNYVLTIQQNVGPSMNPTLQDKEAFLLNKAAYRFVKVKRGDIIAFDYAETKYLVKRVIGLPGERIDYKDNILYINNQPFKEGYIGSDVITADFSMDDIIGVVDSKIPEGMYLVLGDNRGNSTDSRKIGLISGKDIIGKTSVRIWPLNRLGLVD